jgi:hypothetical protein
MADLAPSELLPPSQAWGIRLAFLGIVLVMLSFAGGAVRNPEKFFAGKMVATGDITVMGHDGEQVEAAFERARSALHAEAGLTFMENDRQSIKYQAWLTAPDRAAALAQLEAVLAAFQEEYGGQFGRDVMDLHQRLGGAGSDAQSARVARADRYGDWQPIGRGRGFDSWRGLEAVGGGERRQAEAREPAVPE